MGSFVTGRSRPVSSGFIWSARCDTWPSHPILALASSAGHFGREGTGQELSLALLDQGASSFSSLALQVALISFLDPREFGSYAVAASIQGVAYLALYAVLFEPLSVIGAQKLAAKEGDYFVRVLAVVLLVSLFAAALLGIVALLCAPISARFSYALLGGMIGLPGIALGWFTRGACYLQSRITLALLNSGTSAVLLLIGIFALYQVNVLSAASGLALLGIASGIGAIWPLARLGFSVARVRSALLDGSWRAILNEHRPLAKWGLLNAFAVYAARDLYAPLLAAAGGLELAAIHRAGTIVALPIVKLGSIGVLILQPAASRSAPNWTLRELRVILRWAFAIAGVVGIAAAAALWPSLPPLVDFAFRDPIYRENTFYLFVVVVTTMTFVLVDASVNVVLRAKRRFDLIFWPAFFLGVLAGVLGLIGVWLAGLAGAAAALIGSTTIFLPATIIACLNMQRADSKAHHEPKGPSDSSGIAQAGGQKVYAEVSR